MFSHTIEPKTELQNSHQAWLFKNIMYGGNGDTESKKKIKACLCWLY